MNDFSDLILLENFSQFNSNSPLPSEEIDQIMASLNTVLPADYIQFIRQYNGGEGEVGKAYLILWKFDEIAESNKDYLTDEFAPGYLIFGSDGGGAAYAFERSSGEIVEFAFIGMTMDDEPIPLGNSFVMFLKRLSKE
jgi:hypothetical protein